MAKQREGDSTWLSGSVASEPTSLMAVDPGLNSCGYAYWESPPLEMGVNRWTNLSPDSAGLIKPPRNAPLGARMKHIADELICTVGQLHYRDTHLAVEMPAFQGGAAREMGWKTGDLQKLVLLVGFLCAHDWGRVTLVTPREWKGQLPKDVVIRRLRRVLGYSATARAEYEKDTWDAIGIGVYMWTGRV